MDQTSEAQGQKADATSEKPTSRSSSKKWCSLVIINIIFLLAGQTVATLLGRLYYDKGGNSKWMATIVQSAGFPLIFPLILFHRSFNSTSSTVETCTFKRPSTATLAFVYISIGLLVGADNLMYSYGLLYLPVSTYSLICASQLASNAVFSYFLNAQKFTPPIFNSVILLTFSSALLGVNVDAEGSSNIPKNKYPLGFILTLGASVTYSLILSLTQLSFQKVIKRETFTSVLEMVIYTSGVASCMSVVGLFASGEWKELDAEMHGFAEGSVSYVMILVWTAISWQVASVGVVGLIFVVSSLFSNVISTLALPVVPIFAVIFFHDKMGGVKVMALLLALWGFISYVYQHYLDHSMETMEKRAAACREEP